MATYIAQDIACSLGGDVVIGSNGDLKLADALETYKGAANFVLRTDYGDYAPNKNVGCNLGSFIGELNTEENHKKMETNINRVLRNQIFSSQDAFAVVVPFDLEEALCIVKIAGTYLVSGEFVQAIDQKMLYSFPYIEGSPSPLVI